jgi:hypothetical protein
MDGSDKQTWTEVKELQLRFVEASLAVGLLDAIVATPAEAEEFMEELPYGAIFGEMPIIKG